MNSREVYGNLCEVEGRSRIGRRMCACGGGNDDSVLFSRKMVCRSGSLCVPRIIRVFFFRLIVRRCGESVHTVFVELERKIKFLRVDDSYKVKFKGP